MNSKGSRSNRWQDARKAWARLAGCDHDDPSARARRFEDGADPLEALADVGYLRHLLDQAELTAVRTARRAGRSWAEIATKLGVTRQSAWERWREIDGREDLPTTEILSDTVAEVAAAKLEEITASAGERRRKATVVVPNVVGKSWEDARQLLLERRLIAVGPDPDGPPLAALGWPNGVVTDQSPESGAKVPIGSSVTLWLDRGGGSGVREPRRPKPSPRSGREMRYEPNDEAVG
jgi:hypothetical protein